MRTMSQWFGLCSKNVMSPNLLFLILLQKMSPLILHIWDKTPSKKEFFFLHETTAYICHFHSTACSVIMFFTYHSELEEKPDTLQVW